MRRLSSSKTYFTDVTGTSGIDFMHRSSDWFSRLLRSYLKKSATKVILDIPPAFRDSDVAAGDVNQDGIQDLLLLSGSGNALYLEDGKGHFYDIAWESGIIF